MKTRINENQKVTLTIGQLKQLIKENADENFEEVEHNEYTNICIKSCVGDYIYGLAKFVENLKQFEKRSGRDVDADYVEHIVRELISQVPIVKKDSRYPYIDRMLSGSRLDF